MNRNYLDNKVTFEMRIAKRASRLRPPSRNGSATVELAVCLPVMVILVLGAIEGASMAFLRQTLTQSAYEGVKVAVRRGNSPADSIKAAEAVLASRNLNGVQLTLDPPNPDEAAPGTPITMFATAPSDANSVVSFGPFQGKTVTVRSVMVKE